MLAQNAEEVGLVLDRAPDVARRSFTVARGQAVSAIVWGEAEPELVLLHGGGQNAHTWDTVALSLGRPLLAIDLPGHGHSDRRPDRDYGPWRNAEAVASVMDQAAPRSAGVVGMSLGGATTIRLAATRPDLVRRAVIVDVTPQVQDPSRTMSRADRGAVALVAGPPVYDSFEAMAEAAVAASPRRPRSAVERGVRHNSVRLPDGRCPAAGRPGAAVSLACRPRAVREVPAGPAASLGQARSCGKAPGIRGRKGPGWPGRAPRAGAIRWGSPRSGRQGS
jgi:pimeloyl-ACP methyl ester carboxylesterase